MSWNYRVIRHEAEGRAVWFGLHEVYYDEKGTVRGWIASPEIAVDDAKEIAETARAMAHDADTRPLLNAADLPGYVPDEDVRVDTGLKRATLDLACHLAARPCATCGDGMGTLNGGCDACAPLRRKLENIRRALHGLPVDEAVIDR